MSHRSWTFGVRHTRTEHLIREEVEAFLVCVFVSLFVCFDLGRKGREDWNEPSTHHLLEVKDAHLHDPRSLALIGHTELHMKHGQTAHMTIT